MMNTRFISDALGASARGEEMDLPSGKFAGYIGKGYKYGLAAVAVLGTGMGAWLTFLIRDPVSGGIFGILGIAALLLLPTFFSYRCYVDNSVLRETYQILFFRWKKEVLWKDIKYKSIRKDSAGNAFSIGFYNADKKKLISFDGSIVGFTRILRMAKRKSILKLK